MDAVGEFNRICESGTSFVPSKIVWRKARALEAIEQYHLWVTATESGQYQLDGICLVLEQKTGLSPDDALALKMSTFNRCFSSVLDAVENFLNQLEVIRNAKNKEASS